MRTRISALILTLLFLFAALDAYAQPVTNIGPVTPGNLPVYNSPTVLKDSGIPASGVGGGRQRPVGLQTYYVACDASGNDANNGTSTATPWATLQHAWNFIVANLDLGLGSVQVNWQSTCATSSGNLLTAYPNGFPNSTSVPVVFQAGIFNGSGTTPIMQANGVGVNAGEAIHAAFQVRITFAGSFSMSSAGSDTVRSVFGAEVGFGTTLSDNITCAGSSAGGACLFAGEAGGVIGQNGTIHVTAGGGSIINVQGGTYDAIVVISIDTASLTFSDACFISGNQGVLWASGTSAASTFVGTGKASLICTRWKAREGGAIYAIGETTPDAYFPGNAAGSAQTTGFISSGALTAPQYGLGYGTAFTEASGKNGGNFGNGTWGDQTAALGMGALAAGNCSIPSNGIRVCSNIPNLNGNGSGSIGAQTVAGLIIAGQGSTDDIEFQNKSLAVVARIPTGTLNWVFPSGATVTGPDNASYTSAGLSTLAALGVGGSAGTAGIRVTNSAIPGTSVNGQAAWGASSTGGMLLAGKGSTDDLELQNNANTVVCKIPTGAVNMSCVGTNTNNGAATGFVGEYLRANANPGSALTTATALDCTTLSLTAGDWDVRGAVSYNPNGATIISSIGAALNTTASALPGSGDTNQTIIGPFNTTISDNPTVPVGPHRFSLSVTTTIHLIGYSRFSTNTNSLGPCTIEARRAW